MNQAYAAIASRSLSFHSQESMTKSYPLQVNATPLHLAAKLGRPDLVALLVFWRADPNAQADTVSTRHCCYSHCECVGAHCCTSRAYAKHACSNAFQVGFCKRSASNINNEKQIVALWEMYMFLQGMTALHFSAEDGHAAAAEVLLNIPGFHGVNVKSSSVSQPSATP